MYYLLSVSRGFHRSLKGLLRVSQESLKKIFKVFQRSFKPSQGCFKVVIFVKFIVLFKGEERLKRKGQTWAFG